MLHPALSRRFARNHVGKGMPPNASEAVLIILMSYSSCVALPVQSELLVLLS